MRQIVLDTETTGLEPQEGHRIIEIGCVELVNRKFTGNRFHSYLNPEREIDEGALQVHGITKSFLQDKPLFRDIAPKLIEFLTDAEVIIHNAVFDTAFINHELTLTNQQWKDLSQYCSIVDSLKLARQLHAGQRNSLDALCKRYAVDSSQRELHGALLDAHLLAQVYLAMTGGQGSLFEDTVSNNANAAAKVTVSLVRKLSTQLPVIMADETELQEHANYLQLLKVAEIW